MKFFSILFTFEEVWENLGLHTLWWCDTLSYGNLPLRARKFKRVITLVEAESEEEAIAIRTQSHPELFTLCTRYEVIEVASREEWTMLPDRTFKVPPTCTVLEFDGGHWFDLHKVRTHFAPRSRCAKFPKHSQLM